MGIDARRSGFQGESRGAAVAFVRQKRMAIKEDIRFFRDENETEELFRIKARSVMEFGGRYDVTTPEGELVLLADQDRDRWDRALIAHWFESS